MPATNSAANASTTTAGGGKPRLRNIQNAKNAPSMMKSPCARLTIRITPKTRFIPTPTRAKYRPKMMPVATAYSSTGYGAG